MQTIGRTSVGTAREDDNRIDQAGGTIRCDKSRESYEPCVSQVAIVESAIET